MSEKQRIDRPWREYPIGTLAHAVMGGHWERKVNGWSWNGTGPSFPTPGGDAVSVTLPTPPASQESAGEADQLKALAYAMLAHGYGTDAKLVAGAAATIATLTAELAEAREQRNRAELLIKQAHVREDAVIAERDILRDECERLREVLASLIGATRHLNPCPGTMEQALAALSASGREGE